MCGSFGITYSTTIHLPKRFGFDNDLDMFAKFDEVRYLVMRDIPTVSRNSPNKLVMRKWSIIPPYLDDPKDLKFSTFNARSETIREKATYKNAWNKANRCLIICTFFNETNKETKQKYRISLKSGEPFALAGLYQPWKTIETCTMLTCEPNHDMKHAHHRMPVIIAKEDEDKWLDKNTDLDEAYALLKPYEDGELQVDEVS